MISSTFLALGLIQILKNVDLLEIKLQFVNDWAELRWNYAHLKINTLIETKNNALSNERAPTTFFQEGKNHILLSTIKIATLGPNFHFNNFQAEISLIFHGLIENLTVIQFF